LSRRAGRYRNAKRLIALSLFSFSRPRFVLLLAFARPMFI